MTSQAPMIVGIIIAVLSLVLSVINAVSSFSVQRATAGKVATDSKNVEAETAEVFSNLAEAWATRFATQAKEIESRAAQRDKELTATIEGLQTAIHAMADAIDSVAPYLSIAAEQHPEAAKSVVALHVAARTARRLAS